jgi:hypothetical protein
MYNTKCQLFFKKKQISSYFCLDTKVPKNQGKKNAALRPHGLCPRTWNRAPTRERQRTGHAQKKNKIYEKINQITNLKPIIFRLIILKNNRIFAF